MARASSATKSSQAPSKNPNPQLASSSTQVASILSKLSPEEYRSVMAAAAAEVMMPSAKQGTTSSDSQNRETEAGNDVDAEEVDEIAGTADATTSASNVVSNGAAAQEAQSSTSANASTSARNESQTAAAAAVEAMNAINAQQNQLNTNPGYASNAANVNLHNFRASGGSRPKKGPENERDRKDQHKEVERRRRMHINEGLSRLSQMLPNCDAKGLPKGAVILAAIDYIEDLKNNEASNIEKWTLEKLLMDQHSVDLETRLEASKRECETLRRKLGEAQSALAGPHTADGDGSTPRKRARA